MGAKFTDNMGKTASPQRKTLARKLVVDLTIMTVIGVVLALIGPFGSFEQPLAYRLISWLLFSYIGYAIYSPMGYFVGRLKVALDLPAIGLWLASVLFATIPMTALVWSIGFLPRPVPWPTADQALTSYLYVLVIGGGVTALFYALESREIASGQALPVQPVNPDPAPTGTPRFVDRLPPAIGSDLIALEMEDHYVRAHTTLGSDLVLMRLRDAMAELDGIEGAQVHRSWWVARHAVEDVKREGRNMRLVLATGLEAPVSRTNVSVLKERGWI